MAKTYNRGSYSSSSSSSSSGPSSDAPVRVTVIDDHDDVICDAYTKYVAVKEVGVHVSYVCFDDEDHYPEQLRGLSAPTVQGWEIVVTDDEGELSSGRISKADGLELRYNTR